MTFAVDEAAETESPAATFTATTCPSIGLAIVACDRACCATATAPAAASTAAWSAARSAADGDDDADDRGRTPAEAPPPDPDPPAPLDPDRPFTSGADGVDGREEPEFAAPVFAEPVSADGAGAGAAAARWLSRSSRLFEASTSCCCAAATAVWASRTCFRADWHALTSVVGDGVVVVVDESESPVPVVGAADVDDGDVVIAAQTLLAESSADDAAVSAASTFCCAASTACCAAASCGSLDVDVAAASTIRGAFVDRADCTVASPWFDAPEEFALGVVLAPLGELCPASAFERVSCAWASAASFWCSVEVRDAVSSVASTDPTLTESPTCTDTDATVPATGKATVACDAGSMVPTLVRFASMS